MDVNKELDNKLFIAIDGGGSKTIFAIFDDSGKVIEQLCASSTNPNVVGIYESIGVLKTHISLLVDKYPSVSCAFAGISGVLVGDYREIIAVELHKAFPDLKITVDSDISNLIGLVNDIDTALIIGTGIVGFALKDNERHQIAGWGYLLDEGGSGYSIGKDVLTNYLYECDHKSRYSLMSQMLLKESRLNKKSLIELIYKKDNKFVADFAHIAFDAYLLKDKKAELMLKKHARIVADILKTAKIKYGCGQKILLSGGLIEKYKGVYIPLINNYYPGHFILSDKPQIYGAIKNCLDKYSSSDVKIDQINLNAKLVVPGTESRNQKTTHIDKMSTLEMLKIMNEENYNSVSAVDDVLIDIAKAVDIVSESLSKGHRLFYVGAGTSGRLGVVDASECPPTFGVDDDLVTGIIAGGNEAMFKAFEGVEDSYEKGVSFLKEKGLSKGDSVIGISANGNAKFVIGALEYANEIGANTIALVNNNGCRLIKIAKTSIVISSGPEVVTGSTRLKAGNTQKFVLNMISTCSMIKNGYVYENLMINLKPTNIKLKNRMINIVSTILNCSFEEANKKLEESDWVIKRAIRN